MAVCAVEPTPPAAPVTRMVSWNMISASHSTCQKVDPHS